MLLLSDEDHALATIETKTPYHKASKKERTDFEQRLSGYPTLRTAYFTNGPDGTGDFGSLIWPTLHRTAYPVRGADEGANGQETQGGAV